MWTTLEECPFLPSFTLHFSPIKPGHAQHVALPPAYVLLLQVVAGLQPEQTNVFLQQLAEVAKQHKAKSNPVQLVALACKAPLLDAPQASAFKSIAKVLSSRTGAGWSDPPPEAGQHRL